ncbi:MAG: glycine cleavage system protein GcvH [Candidatus Sumerlaeota bacterium]|nr:glycine cleavage system protein GcvH [Candidatus Sumerlaeota bacterium]
MSNVPKDLKYTTQHEWIRVEGKTGVCGISDHAQSALGDVTFVELPAVGKILKQGAEVCAIESCKAAASVYAPAGGKVIDANKQVEGDPALVNSDPYGAGWIFKLELSDPGELASLMDAAQYEAFLKTQ